MKNDGGNKDPEPTQKPAPHFCPGCGKGVAETAKFCRFCGKKIDGQHQSAKTQPLDPADSKVQCVMVIQDIYWPHDPLHVSIGDLVVTTEALILIELAEYEQSGGFDTFMAGVAYGIVGAGIQGRNSSQNEKAKLLNAQVQVKMNREADYAMSPEERLKKYATATVIKRDDILALETNQKQGLLKIKYSKGELSLALGYSDRIRNWYSGRIEVEPNMQGMNLGLPSIDSLLTSLETGNDIPGVSLHELSSNADYLTRFWNQFGRLNSTRQDAIIKTIIKDKNDLWESASNYFRKLGETTHFKIGYSMLIAFSFTMMLAVIFFILSLFLTDFWTNSSTNEEFVEACKGPGIILSIVFVLSWVGLIIDYINKRNRIKEKLLLFS